MNEQLRKTGADLPYAALLLECTQKLRPGRSQEPATPFESPRSMAATGNLLPLLVLISREPDQKLPGILTWDLTSQVAPYSATQYLPHNNLFKLIICFQVPSKSITPTESLDNTLGGGLVQWPND